MTFFKLTAALGLAALAAVPAVGAGAATPVGNWQTTGGESRFAVSYCGDGTQLCAKLTWLRADARTPENLAYLNQYVVHGARPTGANKWRGTVTYGGERITGSVTLVSNEQLKVSGCKLIACQSLDFVRV